MWFDENDIETVIVVYDEDGNPSEEPYTKARYNELRARYGDYRVEKVSRYAWQ